MKKITALLATLLISVTMLAQNESGALTPQISVSGTGKVSVVPDRAIISVGVENRTEDAISAKKANDASIAKVISFIKSMNIDSKDYQTKRVNLYKSRDYDKKKDFYQASQTIIIALKDIEKYEELMVGLMNSGINQIQGVEFRSSQSEKYETEARTKAANDAKKKATDYASALGQKVGKAVVISDQSSQMPIPRSYSAKQMLLLSESNMNEETLAIGEIEIISNVSISFYLE